MSQHRRTHRCRSYCAVAGGLPDDRAPGASNRAHPPFLEVFPAIPAHLRHELTPTIELSAEPRPELAGLATVH